MPINLAELETQFKDEPEVEEESAEEVPEESEDDLSNEEPDGEDNEEDGEADSESSDESEEPGEGEDGETADEDVEEGEETEEDVAHEGEDIPDEAKFKVGDEVLTGKEIKLGRLRQADYTKKTQELAEERKAHAAEREELEDLKDWIKDLADPEEMRFELERYFPDQFEALREAIIQEAIDEAELTETARADRRRARVAEMRLKAQDKDKALEDKRTKRKEEAQKTADLRVQFDKWVDETLKEAGLDPKDPEHQSLVRERMAVRYRGQKWTRELFLKVSQNIAKLVGVKPPAPKKTAKPAAKKAAPAPAKLPPSPRPSGVKAPSAEKAKAKKAKKPSDPADVFAKIRKEAGVH